MDELTGAALNFEQVKQGMQTDEQQLERLKVGCCLIERKGRELAKEKQVTVLTSRWVLTQKTADIARCRIVARDFATGSASALNLAFMRQLLPLTDSGASLQFQSSKICNVLL